MRVLLGLAALLPFVLAGCGLGAGYAPEVHTVHTGRAEAMALAPVDSFVVVTWNIQYGQDLAQALAELRAHPELSRADVLLLQEMDPDGARRLAGALDLHHVYSPASVHRHHQELFGNAVLSRWPIVAHDVRPLPHPTPVTGHRRIAVAARLDLGAGRRLAVASVHTATMISSQRARFEQAAAALDSVLDGEAHVVVAGDFNTVTDHEVRELRRLGRKRGYRHLRLPPGPTVTNRLKRFPGSVPRLDHVLYRGLEPGRRGVARRARASDHYPVWAVFALPPPVDDG